MKMNKVLHEHASISNAKYIHNNTENTAMNYATEARCSNIFELIFEKILKVHGKEDSQLYVGKQFRGSVM